MVLIVGLLSQALKIFFWGGGGVNYFYFTTFKYIAVDTVATQLVNIVRYFCQTETWSLSGDSLDLVLFYLASHCVSWLQQCCTCLSVDPRMR